MLGRIAGLLVIVVAVGVLIGGAVAILGGSRPSSTPRASTARPSAGPQLASPTPVTPSGFPSPSPTPSAAPTALVPVVRVGPGFVTFGTRTSADKSIADPRAVFRFDETVTWSAFLSEPATPADLLVRVLKLDPGAAGGERLLSEARLQPRAGEQRLVRRIRPARVLDGPGVYAVRYLRGETIVAEGYFLIE